MTSLPDGYNVRHPSEADFPAIQAFLDLCEAYDTGDGNVHEFEIAVAARDPEFDFDENVWLVETDGGDIAGFCWLWKPRAERAEITGEHYVHPEHRDAAVLRAIHDVLDGRVAELAAEWPQSSSLILFGDDHYPECGAALEARGHVRVRDFYSMRIDPKPDWRPAHAVPDGFEVRPFDASTEAKDVYQADREAFSEHYLFVLLTFEEWRIHTVDRDDFEPSLWLVAWDGDQVAGMCWGVPRKGEVYIEYLSVRKPWRGRGLGIALLQQVFSLLLARGHARIRLMVDAQNATGALRLYERAGMHVERSFGAYERKLR